ncbi:P-loop NTPase [Humibacter albus]|uniref:P-loop NTPase n=1 Tax=Humibacter albus TaxID=427754 RepID=UPI0003B5A115|nr:P-loop NTPase [Humibacter albus]
MVDAEGIRAALSGVIDPEIRRPITELDMVDEISVDAAGRAFVRIKLTIVGCPAAARIESDVREAVTSVPDVDGLDLEVSVMSPAERSALTERLRGARKRANQFTAASPTRVYAVTSGKGGVGKSTVTANLAVALAQQGLKVGLVDADVYGFSIPGILGLVHDGVTQQPTRVDDMILPPIAYDVKVISIGMFLDPSRGQGAGTAVAWRGPMLHRTISQFLTDVFFDDLDVLLLDLPPGTGDVAISVGQLLPGADVLVITTPQPAAADVAVRSGVVARQTGQQVFGVIENMAGLPQPDGTVLDLFGSGGGAEVAARLTEGMDDPVPLLASVPLSVALRSGGDTGEPIVVSDPDDPAAVAIRSVAERIASRPRKRTGRALNLNRL